MLLHLGYLLFESFQPKAFRRKPGICICSRGNEGICDSGSVPAEGFAEPLDHQVGHQDPGALPGLYRYIR